MTTLEFATKELERRERDRKLVVHLRANARGKDARNAELEQLKAREGWAPTWAEDLANSDNGSRFLADLHTQLDNDMALLRRVIAQEKKAEKWRAELVR